MRGLRARLAGRPSYPWMVLGVALACSSGISVRKGLLAIVGFWVVKTLILVITGAGQYA